MAPSVLSGGDMNTGRIIPLSLAFASVLFAGCAVDQAQSEEATEGDVATSSEALSSTPLLGKVTAYTDNPVLPWSGGRQQTFGPGTYLANAGELSGVGNDAIRYLEIGPAMRVIACEHEYAYPCTTYENLTGGNRVVATTGGISRLIVRGLMVGYRDASYGGAAFGFEIGRHEVSRHSFGPLGNDTLSSLRLAPGLTARVCSDDPETTVGGTCVTFSGDTSAVSTTLNDRASWIEVRPRSVLYRDPNLNGVSQAFGPGRFPVSSLSVVGNDTTSSVLVHEGVSTRICSDDPYATVGGTCGTFLESALTLASNLDNRTSWLEDRHNVILAPLNDETRYESATDGFTLRGYATSPTDGELPGASIRWYSSRDGFLGTGNALRVRLSETGSCSGTEHVISMIATDSRGVSMTTTRKLQYYRIC